MDENSIRIFIFEICRRNPFDFTAGLSHELEESGVQDGVRTHDSKTIFDWLMAGFSFQGISDKIAQQYLEDHGNITYRKISEALRKTPTKCQKLQGFDAFQGCGFKKTSKTCKNQSAYDTCPLPSHNLRKGQLNQLGYSLYFFIRDVCQGDLVGFIDKVFDNHAKVLDDDEKNRKIRDELISEFNKIYGVSYKVLNMMISGLLIGGDQNRFDWVKVGQAMIVIDSLVHKILHRTGILRYYQIQHNYTGSKCYQSDGCITAIDNLSKLIDCRNFNPDYPRYFPRFVQHSLWHYCAQTGGNICNGNRIKDNFPCENIDCFFYPECEKIPFNR